ncbi:MAG TPA: type II secretion system F family protein [Burkholderiales bacterium]|jgi:tight adherence protein B|nr:type II secretion system F family protein [Burkholderiales bacterium]
MDLFMLGFAFAGFLAVVLMLEGAYLLWNSHRSAEAKRLQARLRLLSAGERLSVESELLKDDMKSRLPKVYRWLLGLPRLQRLDRMLLQSGLERSLPGLFAWSVTFGIVGLLLGALLPLAWWAAPVCGVALGCLPFARILWARDRRLAAIEQQLPDALDLMGRAMRAGHAFPTAVQMVANEGPEPIAQEFRVTFDEVNYGVPMQDALGNLATRVPVADLRFFVVAVAIQRETGGNLTELLDKLARLVRERFRLMGLLRVLSAEGRLSAWILSVLPFGLIAVIHLVNPKFIALLWTDRAGLYALQGSVLLMVIGIFWMWRTIKIKF